MGHDQPTNHHPAPEREVVATLSNGEKVVVVPDRYIASSRRAMDVKLNRQEAKSKPTPR